MADEVVLTTRSELVAVLIDHQRVSMRMCGCGWDALGKSFAEHVADEVQEGGHG